METWMLIFAGATFGGAVFGGAIGYAMGHRDAMKNDEVLDTDDFNEAVNVPTTLYQCRMCGQTILQRLPTGLTGEFEHARCAGRGDEVLEAEVIE